MFPFYLLILTLPSSSLQDRWVFEKVSLQMLINAFGLGDWFKELRLCGSFLFSGQLIQEKGTSLLKLTCNSTDVASLSVGSSLAIEFTQAAITIPLPPTPDRKVILSGRLAFGDVRTSFELSLNDPNPKFDSGSFQLTQESISLLCMKELLPRIGIPIASLQASLQIDLKRKELLVVLPSLRIPLLGPLCGESEPSIKELKLSVSWENKFSVTLSGSLAKAFGLASVGFLIPLYPTLQKLSFTNPIDLETFARFLLPKTLSFLEVYLSFSSFSDDLLFLLFITLSF